MTLALIAALATAGVIAALALLLANDVSPASWPEEETPLHVRDNRSHDLQLTHLARLAAARDPQVLHETVTSLVDRLVATTAVMSGPAGTDPRAVLPADTQHFLAAPPGAADDYRRALARVLDRIEAL